MGFKHCPDFLDRVYGYRVVKNGLGEMINKSFDEAGLKKEKKHYNDFFMKKRRMLTNETPFRCLICLISTRLNAGILVGNLKVLET